MRGISSGDTELWGHKWEGWKYKCTHEATISLFHLDSIIAALFLLVIHLTGSVMNIHWTKMPQSTKQMAYVIFIVIFNL